MTQSTEQLANLSPDDKRRLLQQLLQRKAASNATFPLSHGQSGMWVTSQIDRENPVFNMPFCTRFRTKLDIDAFRRTMQTLVDRHACLRTRFYEHNGELKQTVDPKVEFNIDVQDASGLDDTQLQKSLEQELAKPFNLERAPALRATLFALAPDDHICLLAAHHIVIDFWSAVVLQRELHAIYTPYKEGRRIDLPPVKHSFREFVEWQNDLLASEIGKQRADFWQTQLEGADHILHLPNDQDRPGIFTHHGGVAACKIDANVTTRLNELATSQNATLYSVLLAGFQLLLGRYCNQSQFVVGSPFSGRDRSEFEDIVGCFVNLLPIRADLAGDPTFREVIDRTFETVVNVLENQDFPFSAIVEQSGVDRDPVRAPLVQASFTMQKSHRREQSATTKFLVPDVEANQSFGALDEQAFYVDNPSCQHDLELLLEQSSDSINGMLRYYADAFYAETIERMVRNFAALLDIATRNPDTPISQLNWFCDDERQLVIDGWNQTSVDFGPPQPIHQRFESQAARTPEDIAVSDCDSKVTYRQLDQLVNRSANLLADAGVKPGDFVAVNLERSPELIVAILGIMKAGAAYVPLDPQSPIERKRQILADTNAVVVISREEQGLDRVMPVEDVAPLLANGQIPNSEPLSVVVSPNDVAYVLFTSGSTGVPKGVVVEHKAIGNTISWRQHTIPVTSDDRVLLMVPHYFDASLCITLQAILGGANLVLAAPEVTLDPAALGGFIEQQQITLLPMPPRLLRVLLEHGDNSKLQTVKRIHTGGEAMPPELPGLVHRSLGVPFENLYGPTETAVEATWKSCSDDSADANRIGKPIANVRTYILDEHRRPVPIGVHGELYIGGDGLARGYLNDDALTAERFVDDPFVDTAGARMYRTGDQCRWLANGEIEFIARIDHQVKVRGYRIEVSEIENVLRLHSTIDDVAVVTHAVAGDDDLSLVAYIVCTHDALPTASEMRSHLETRLPTYMVPHFYEFLTAMPYTPTGKLDRKALPAPKTNRASRELVPPRNELEAFLAGVWQELLPGQTIGIHDNFYDLGGSSLKGAMLLSRMQDRMGQQIRLATVFHLPDVASLAQHLGETYPEIVVREFGVESLPTETVDSADGMHSLLVPLQPNGKRTPLFMIHPPGGIVVCYQAMSRLMPNDQPLYGIRARGLFGNEDLPETLSAMANEYVDAIRSVQPSGPYLIGGWSLGGVIAFEVAQQLTATGDTVEQLIMLDTTVPSEEDDESGREYGIEMTFGELADLPADEQLPYLFEHARKVGVVDNETPDTLIVQILEDLKRLFHHHVTLANDYSLQSYAGTITMFRPDDAPVEVEISPDRGWKSFANVVVESVPGQHHSMVKRPHVDVLAEKLTRIIS